jgi:sugar lactone lactonase YvrE
VSVEVAIDARAELGEGPRWDDATERLLWVDIEGRSLHVFDPETGDDRAITLDNRVGVGQPMSDGRVLVALADRLAALDLEDESVETLVPMPHGPRLRLNDGNCDPQGSFWVGSLELEFAPGTASLYRYDGELREVLTGVTISNGIGWSPDGTLMYYVDTRTHGVDAFDFDGLPTGRRRFATIERAGWPDGLAVDDEGGVWVALWGGSAVRRYAPDGTLDEVIEVPALNVTACCFGGRGRNRLFITTAAPDGRMYVTDVAVTGPPAQPFQSTAPSEAEPTSRR